MDSAFWKGTTILDNHAKMHSPLEGKRTFFATRAGVFRWRLAIARNACGINDIGFGNIYFALRALWHVISKWNSGGIDDRHTGWTNSDDVNAISDCQRSRLIRTCKTFLPYDVSHLRLLEIRDRLLNLLLLPHWDN